MATLEDIDAEIARRQRVTEIDAAIAQKQGGVGDAVFETIGSVAGNVGGTILSGLGGIKELISTGDLDSAVKEIARIQQSAQEQFAPETEAGKQGVKNVASAFQTLDENVIRPVAAGTVGLANVVANPIANIQQDFAPAKQQASDVLDKGFGKAAGEEIFSTTGSPLLATVAETSPDLAELLIPGSKAKSAAKGVKAKAGLNLEEAQAALKAAEDIRAGKVIETSSQDVANVIAKGTDEDLAAIVQADPKFYQAVDELGIDVEPIASFASKNPQFRSISNALEVAVGSDLEPQAFKFIDATAKAADDLITQYGGSTDKAQLGLDFKRESLKNIEDLYDSADEVYGQLRTVVDETQQFKPQKTLAFLNELDKADKLSPKLRSVLNQLRPKTKTVKGASGTNTGTGRKWTTDVVEEINPKLGRIDILRKQFGQAIGKGSGNFKDQETGLNKAIYARLTNDLDNISEQLGGDALALSDAGKGLVRQRKQLEDNVQSLLGKDLNQALSTTVGGAVKALSKNEVDRFLEVVNAIPKNKRKEIVLSSLNDVFRGTAVNKQGLDATQFTKWFQTINRSPAAKKALFDNLPKESRKAIENLFEVSKGISRSLGQKKATGISKLFDQDIGLISKMLGSTAVKAAVALKGGPVGSASAGMVSELLSQTSSPAKAATALLASDDFKQVIRQSVKEGVFDGNKASKTLLDAEQRLMKTARYKKWADTLAKEDAAALGGGLLGYLTTNQETAQEQQ